MTAKKPPPASAEAQALLDRLREMLIDINTTEHDAICAMINMIAEIITNASTDAAHADYGAASYAADLQSIVKYFWPIVEETRRSDEADALLASVQPEGHA